MASRLCYEQHLIYSILISFPPLLQAMTEFEGNLADRRMNDSINVPQCGKRDREEQNNVFQDSTGSITTVQESVSSSILSYESKRWFAYQLLCLFLWVP